MRFAARRASSATSRRRCADAARCRGHAVGRARLGGRRRRARPQAVVAAGRPRRARRSATPAGPAPRRSIWCSRSRSSAAPPCPVRRSSRSRCCPRSGSRRDGARWRPSPSPPHVPVRARRRACRRGVPASTARTLSSAAVAQSVTVARSRPGGSPQVAAGDAGRRPSTPAPALRPRRPRHRRAAARRRRRPARAVGRLRQAAHAVRQADRQLPGRQAPARRRARRARLRPSAAVRRRADSSTARDVSAAKVACRRRRVPRGPRRRCRCTARSATPPSTTSSLLADQGARARHAWGTQRYHRDRVLAACGEGTARRRPRAARPKRSRSAQGLRRRRCGGCCASRSASRRSRSRSGTAAPVPRSPRRTSCWPSSAARSRRRRCCRRLCAQVLLAQRRRRGVRTAAAAHRGGDDRDGRRSRRTGRREYVLDGDLAEIVLVSDGARCTRSTEVEATATPAMDVTRRLATVRARAGRTCSATSDALGRREAMPRRSR